MKSVPLFILATALSMCTSSVSAAHYDEIDAMLQGFGFPGANDFSVTSSSGRVFTISAYDNGRSMLHNNYCNRDWY